MGSTLQPPRSADALKALVRIGALQERAANLFDGLTYVFGGGGANPTVIGWTSSQSVPFPHEFVVSFYQGREATISAVILDTRSFDVVTNREVRTVRAGKR